jgi:hypothetical protein
MNPLVVQLLFSSFDVVWCSYHHYCVLIHVNCLAQRLIHTAINIYVSTYMPKSARTTIGRSGRPGGQLIVLVVA